MNRLSSLLLRVALQLTPRSGRSRRAQEWRGDLLAADGHGLSPVLFAAGLVRAALTTRRPTKARARQHLAVGAALGLLLPGAAAVTFWQAQPPCTTVGQVLASVPGKTALDLDASLPPSVTSAMRALRQADAFEGVWAGPDRRAYVGVYGPRWNAARNEALLAARGTGVPIVFVCQPVTERDLVRAQQRVTADPSWKRNTIGFSSIDIPHAHVIVGIVRTSPPAVERELKRRVGPTLRIQRSDNPFPDFGPGQGRIPLAQDNPQPTTARTTANT